MDLYNDTVSDGCINCLTGWKNFRNLTPEQLAMVNENRYEATFKPGEIIIKQGSPSSNAVFLRSGMAKMYIEGDSGHNMIMGIALPSVLIAGPGTYVNSRNSYSVAAMKMVQACFVSFDIIRELVRNNSLFAEGLIEDISMKSFKTHLRMLSLTQKRMHGRLAETILMFADEVFGSDEFEMLLSRQEIGDMTNMAKESVVRILKEFESEGIIDAGCPRMRIIDKDRLRIISEKG
jgi:CRP/FNR family transcriptional regulator, polysaccharide utilization system transcription regulator